MSAARNRSRARARRIALELLMRVVMSAAIVLAALWVARAGAASGTRSALTFAGTLRTAAGAPIVGPVALRFVFKHGDGQKCAVDVLNIFADPKTGAFDALVPVDTCPAETFDGTDTTLEVAVDGVVAVTDQPIGSAPYAKFAEHAGTADCPPGYDRVPPPSGTNFVFCRMGNDDIARVGSGASAFWIDRYEDSVWSDRLGNDAQLSWLVREALDPIFPRSGSYTTPAHAVSHPGAFANGFLSWPRAVAACAAAGKRLMTVDEFFEAARGTVDPATPSTGADRRCATATDRSFLAGALDQCVSAWGVQDMVGSHYETTGEWLVGIGTGIETHASWPADFASDATYNIINYSPIQTFPSMFATGLPNYVFRGGPSFHGTPAGIFQVTWASLAYVHGAPTVRCVIPR
jgi:hypothetical protein